MVCLSKTLLVASALALTFSTAASQMCPQGGCQPWAGSSCKKGTDYNLIFNIAPEVLSNGSRALGLNTIKFAYRPVVDQLQAFTLQDAPVNASSYMGTIASNTTTLPFVPYTTTPDSINRTYVYFQGAGEVTDPNLFPLIDGDSSALFMELGGDGRTCPGNQIAIADFLVFNVTMTDGIFKWGSAGEPPIQVGFDPTCDGDSCLLDANKKCMGLRAGRKNCARCINYDQLVGETKINVFLSYYGTDSSGRAFVSGAENPLKFEQFSFNPVFGTVFNDIN
jgi:hypothetical protein